MATNTSSSETETPDTDSKQSGEATERTDSAASESNVQESRDTASTTSQSAAERGPDVRQTALAVRDTGRSVASTLALGLKVLASEYKWLGLKGMRAFEIKQLTRRLNQEYTELGRALSRTVTDPEAGEATIAIDEDTRLILRQISFLRDEISLLEEEREKLREHFVARRRDAWMK